MSRIGQWVEENLGPGATGSRGRHLVIGGLVLIAAFAIILAIWGAIGSGERPGQREDAHFWCEKSGKEYVFAPDEIPGGESVDMAQSMGERIMNPDTGERTLIPMDQCPQCREYFVPAALKAKPGDRPVVGVATERPICPHCQTDVIKWYEQRHGKE